MTDTQLPSLHAYFSYRDAPAAIAWLERAFGFEQTMRFDDETGVTAHAELRLGAIGIIVFSDAGADYGRLPQREDALGHGTYITVADQAAVDTVWASATEAGATPVWKPGSTEWGNYRCRVLDTEGYEWTFGTHRPGLPQSGW